MSDFGNLLEEKCMNFSIRIIGLCRFLNEEKHEYRIADQMFRSGTSIGANAKEAAHGQSKADFYAKMYIAYKEANETEYWLELLHESGYIKKEAFDSIYLDCKEIIRILAAITKTQKQY